MKSPIEKMTFEQRLREDESVSHVDFGGKNFLGRGEK